MTAQTVRREIPQIPAEYIIKVQQRDYIKAEGLTYLGHLQGLKRVTATVVKAPSEDDISCIVHCEVETDLGVFSDFGEVSSRSKGQVGAQYPLSLASTRARNRALRIATNCPLASYEEVDFSRRLDRGEEPPAPEEDRRQQQQYSPRERAPLRELPPAVADVPPECQPATKEQLTRLAKLQAALGQPLDAPESLSFQEAAHRLTTLVKQFNDQAKGGKR